MEEFGGAFTLEDIDNMRNIDYLMLHYCRVQYGKRMKRESESNGGTSFIDKKAIGATDG